MPLLSIALSLLAILGGMLKSARGIRRDLCGRPLATMDFALLLRRLIRRQERPLSRFAITGSILEWSKPRWSFSTSSKPATFCSWIPHTRVFTNSDVTTVFLDIVPRLAPGVLVQFHDIFWPSDYPPEWNQRYYSEQYLLACYILAGGERMEIELPNAFISGDERLGALLSPLWEWPELAGLERHGCSFWIQIK